MSAPPTPALPSRANARVSFRVVVWTLAFSAHSYLLFIAEGVFTMTFDSTDELYKIRRALDDRASSEVSSALSLCFLVGLFRGTNYYRN